MSRTARERSVIPEMRIEEIRDRAYERAGSEVLSGRFDPGCYAKASLACRGRDQDLENTYIEMRAVALFRQLKDERERKSALPTLVVAQPEFNYATQVSLPTQIRRQYFKMSALVLHFAIIFGVFGSLMGLTTLVNKYVDMSLVPKVGGVVLMVSFIPLLLHQVVKRKMEFVSYIQVLAMMATLAALGSVGTAFLLVRSTKGSLAMTPPPEISESR
ncbi:MAG: hypothetical protein ACSHYF_14340 [Verrucomicrobiaceae bacterium]